MLNSCQMDHQEQIKQIESAYGNFLRQKYTLRFCWGPQYAKFRIANQCSYSYDTHTVWEVTSCWSISELTQFRFFLLPARWASGFFGDQQQNHQGLWFHSCYNVTQCIQFFIVCILLGLKLLLLIVLSFRYVLLQRCPDFIYVFT